MMKTQHLVVAAAAIAFVTFGAIPAVAHAQEDRVMFTSPSGNIRCAMTASAGEPASVACQLENITYTVPAGASHDDNGAPCPGNSGSGRDVRLVAGAPGYVRCSYAALGGGMTVWPTLAYGQSQTLGGITCDSTPIAVICTDTASQHFFRISRDAYEVG